MRQRRDQRLQLSEPLTEPPTCPPSKDSETHRADSSATGHRKVAGSRKLLQVATTKISLQQADRNISHIGKPDKMYPYTNYPPVNLRQHNSLVYQSRPSSSDVGSGVKMRLVQSARGSRPSRPHSGQSLKSRSLSSTHYSHGKRMPRHTKYVPANGIQNHCESPTSGIDANHSSRSHHTEPRMSMNVINLESVDLPPGNQRNRFDDGSLDESGSEDSENGGSTSSIDGLMFHDVGQVNDLQSLGIPTTSSNRPAITPTELLQILRLASNGEGGKRSLQRSSSYNHRASKRRPEISRRFSLGAIPEGEIVTHYPEEHAEGSLNLDEEFLYSIMPFAFQGTEDTSENQPHKGLSNTGQPSFASPSVGQQSRDTVHSSLAKRKGVPSAPPSRNEPTQQQRIGPLSASVVTVAWESDSHVDTNDDRPVSPRTGQPRLPLSPTGLEPVADSPPQSPSHVTHTSAIRTAEATLNNFHGTVKNEVRR